MKYIKLFDNYSDLESHYGITPDELKYYFIDITDEGFELEFKYLKRMVKIPSSGEVGQGQWPLTNYKFVLVPFIKVSIFGKDTKSIEELQKSDLFSDTISVANERLENIGLFIKEHKIEQRYTNNQLSILIYRKSEENIKTL